MELCGLSKNDYKQFTTLINSNISENDYNNFIDEVLHEDHLIIILKLNKNLIGTGTLLIEKKLTYGGCKMGHIENILIDENYRGNGYGELLVNHLLKLCKEKKCYRVDLNCNSELENCYKKMNLKQKHICMNIYFKENFI